MKKKTIAILASVVLVAGAATAAVIGLSNQEKAKPTAPSVSYTVTLQNEKLMMTVGDEGALIADFTRQDGLSLSFTSSDESVVKVDNYGRLWALREGTAIVTAYYGTATDTCEVTVSMNGLSPLLQLSNIPSEAICMDKSSFIDLNGTVLFNGKTYEDVALTYEVADATVGTIVDGVFTPSKAGTTEIYVKGEWRGSTAASLSKTITVTILPELFLAVNGGATEITVYTQTNKVSPVDVKLELDGVPLENRVEVTGGNEYIRYDDEKKTVTSRGYVGEAEITIYYEFEGEPSELVIPVHVKPTIYKYENTVENFSAIHGSVAAGRTLKSILGTDIVTAYDADGNALEVSGNKVYGVPSNDDGKFETQITICSNTHGYLLDVEGYTGVFSKAEDFAVFNTNVQYGYTDENGNTIKDFVPVDSTKPMQVWKGYYVLLNNIDASNYTHASSGVSLYSRGIQSGYPYGFNGTFDGQGYTVKGMTMQSFGLFGYVNNSVIKDVAFVDVTLSTTADYTTTLAQWINESVISNVYISIANEGAHAKRGTPFAGGVNASKLVGCIVETKESFTFKNGVKALGSFVYNNKQLFDGNEKQSTFEDVYVVSNAWLGYYQSSEIYMQAENENLQVEEGARLYTITGVKKYATLADMQAANNAYSSFAKSCWSIENGAPVWKSINGDYPSMDDLIIDTIPDKETVGDFDVEWLK